MSESVSHETGDPTSADALQQSITELGASIDRVLAERDALIISQRRLAEVNADLLNACKGIATHRWPDLTLREQAERLDNAYDAIAKAEGRDAS